MRVLEAHATFGKLSGASLSFESGLNIVELMNEGGKSTWCAFIRAMLYGLDTKDRDRAPTKDRPLGYVADKNRYQPWNGAPMSGRMVVLCGSRKIEITRGSGKAGPMQAFSARFMDTLEPVPEMTGENCGRMLCGVSAEAFEKSAFIGSAGPICPGSDAELENRINALITTGSEEITEAEIAARLNRIKNDIRANAANGALPRTLSELSEVERQIEKAQAMAERENTLHADLLTRKKALSEATRDVQLAEAHAAADRAELRAQAERRYHEAVSRREDAERALTFSGESVGWEWMAETQKTLADMRAAETARQMAAKKHADAAAAYDEAKARLEQLAFRPREEKKIKEGRRFIFLPLGIALCAMVAVFKEPQMLIALLALVALFLLYLVLKKRKEHVSVESRRKTEEEAVLSEKFEYTALLRAAQETLAESKALADQKRAAMTTRMGFLGIYPASLDEAEAALHDLSEKIRLLEKRRINESETRAEFVALCAHAEEAPDARPESRRPEKSLDELKLERERAREAVLAAEKACAHAAGERSAAGELPTLFARREKLMERVTLLEKRLAALEVAAVFLNEEAGRLRAEVSPALSEKAAAFFNSLTGGKYVRFELKEGFQTLASESQSQPPVSALRLSTGTAEQMYLALRLALCTLVLAEERPPIILDDAFTNFDTDRLKYAFQLLKKLSDEWQIIYFTSRPVGEFIQ